MSASGPLVAFIAALILVTACQGRPWVSSELTAPRAEAADGLWRRVEMRARLSPRQEGVEIRLTNSDKENLCFYSVMLPTSRYYDGVFVVDDLGRFIEREPPGYIVDSDIVELVPRASIAATVPFAHFRGSLEGACLIVEILYFSCSTERVFGREIPREQRGAVHGAWKITQEGLDGTQRVAEECHALYESALGE
jgi:hypothetical protein